MKTYTWYVYPLDSLTNRIIGQGLEEDVDEALSPDTLCSDDIRRNLWKMDREKIAELNRNKAQLGLRFLVFAQEGKGEIRLSKIDHKPLED